MVENSRKGPFYNPKIRVLDMFHVGAMRPSWVLNPLKVCTKQPKWRSFDLLFGSKHFGTLPKAPTHKIYGKEWIENMIEK